MSTEPKDSEVRDLFARAWLDVLANGWHQGGFFPEDHPWGHNEPAPDNCPACALGSLVRVTGQTFFEACENPVFQEAEERLDARIKDYFPEGQPLRGIGVWNDMEDRTEREVLDIFKELAGPEAIYRVATGG